MSDTFLIDPNQNIKCEIFFKGGWVQFDAQGIDTEESRKFYKNMYAFAQGSFPIRYRGVKQTQNSNEDAVFYRR